MDSLKFVKIITEGVLESGNLVIPPHWIKDVFKGNPPAQTVLRSKNGNIWEVTIAKCQGIYCFTYGWDVYIHDNFLSDMDVLVFIYNGDGSFNVLHFDESEGEKEFIMLKDEDEDELGETINGNPRLQSPAVAATAFHSTNPHFTDAYYKKRNVHIQAAFMRDQRLPAGQNAALHVGRRSYSVKICNSGTTGKFIGCTQFFTETGLRGGHTCVFELTNVLDFISQCTFSNNSHALPVGTLS